MKEDLSGENMKEYEKEIDKKLEGILSSLDIEIEPNSINYCFASDGIGKFDSMS